MTAPVSGHTGSRLLLAVLRAMARLPYPVLSSIGRGLGTLAWWLAAPRRRVALINLRLCFPKLPEPERRRIAHRHFRYFMRSFVDRFILWYQPPERIRELVRLEGREILDAHLGRPLILLAPHFVGIDAGGIRLSMEIALMTIYARQKNAVLNEAMRAGRARFSGIVLSRQQGLRAVLRPLRDGVPFYFLPDMDLGSRDAVFVPFFGVDAATVTSTARLAQLTRAAVVPFVTTMTRDGYVGRFYPAWENDPDEADEAAARRMNAFIEQRVLEMPAQYLWTHKRFKTRPPGQPSPYHHD